VIGKDKKFLNKNFVKIDAVRLSTLEALTAQAQELCMGY